MSNYLDPQLAIKAANAELCRRSLAHFTKQAWSTVNPGTPLLWGWHIQTIADHIQALYEGKLQKRRLIISVPPRSLKTTITSVMFPAWAWLRDPTATLLSISGADRVLMATSIASHELLASNWYRETFNPAWEFSKKADNNEVYMNTAKGTRCSITIGGSVQGSGGNILILDDVTQSNKVSSKLYRNEIARQYESLAGRMNDPRTAITLLIAQRNHQNDLTGMILSKEADLWTSLVLPMEFDPDRKSVTLAADGSVFWEDPRKAAGELLFPERWGQEEIATLKQGVGGMAFYSTQYLQLPSDTEGELFKKADPSGEEYCQTFSRVEFNMMEFERIILVVDPALKAKETSDPSGLLVLGETENSGYWVLDNRTARYGNAELEAMIIALAEKWHPSTVVIEENAHGQSLITRLEDTTNISVTPIFKSRDKVWYANQHAVPLWESRKVRVPSFEPWAPGFLEELYSFPKGLHDDQVDCFSMGLNELVEGSPGQGFLKWLESSSKKTALREAD